MWKPANETHSITGWKTCFHQSSQLFSFRLNNLYRLFSSGLEKSCIFPPIFTCLYLLHLLNSNELTTSISCTMEGSILNWAKFTRTRRRVSWWRFCLVSSGNIKGILLINAQTWRYPWSDESSSKIFFHGMSLFFKAARNLLVEIWREKSLTYSSWGWHLSIWANGDPRKVNIPYGVIRCF